MNVLEIVRTAALVLIAAAFAFVAIHGLEVHHSGTVAHTGQVYTPNISVP
jgi:hypothetical protein